VRGRDDAVGDDRHEGRALDRPRVDDVLVGLALEAAHDGVDRHGDAGQDRLDMGIDERGDLISVGATEGTNFDRRHGEPLYGSRGVSTL